MLPEKRLPTHPGEILQEEFLKPLGITPKTAWLLSKALDMTPEFWINLQSAYDLALSYPKRQINKFKKVS